MACGERCDVGSGKRRQVTGLQRSDLRRAQALGNLRRQGYAVTAVVVLLREEAGEEALARLSAEVIYVRSVLDEASLAVLCQTEMSR